MIGTASSRPPALVFDQLPSGVTASYNAQTGVVTFVGMPTELSPGERLEVGITYVFPEDGVSIPVEASIAIANPDTNPDNDSDGATTINSDVGPRTTREQLPVPVESIPVLPLWALAALILGVAGLGRRQLRPPRR